MAHTQDPFAGGNAALITEFIAQAEVKERTRLKYRTHLLEFDRWLDKAGSPQAEGDVRKVQTGDIARFMAYLRGGDRWAKSDVKKVGRDTPSPSTRKNFHASLSSFYRYLTAVGLVSHNPVLAIDAPKVPHKPGLHLTADEVRRLLEWPGRPRERVQVFLITFTGARSDEIRSLRWQDIDFPNQTMLIRGKGDKYRVIDIHPRLMAELRRWYLYQDVYASTHPGVRAARENPETDYVLLTLFGKKVPNSTMLRQLKYRAAQAGLHPVSGSDRDNCSKVTIHSLRRTFGSILLNDGHHIDAVADVLGHTSINTTRKHYAFSSTERRKATIHGFNV